VNGLHRLSDLTPTGPVLLFLVLWGFVFSTCYHPRQAGKIAEVCICYTSDVLTSSIYNIDYYRTLAKQCVDAGAHIIGIKDMAGLLKPRAAEPLIRAIREVRQ
jgi:pyruvate carboxylase